jgi:hypothetical protein
MKTSQMKVKKKVKAGYIVFALDLLFNLKKL